MGKAVSIAGISTRTLYEIVAQAENCADGGDVSIDLVWDLDRLLDGKTTPAHRRARTVSAEIPARLLDVFALAAEWATHHYALWCEDRDNDPRDRRVMRRIRDDAARALRACVAAGYDSDVASETLAGLGE